MTERMIRSAIASRSVISFFANGKSRIGEPHLLGVTKKSGAIQVELYQTGGDSVGNRGPIPDWRRFNVEDMSRAVMTDDSFSPRADFNPGNDHWAQVLASVL